MAEQVFTATGKRKTSIARVRMVPGKGNILINKKSLDDFFGGLEQKKTVVKQPLVLIDFNNTYDIHVNVQGGGTTGQAEAIRHGISKTLLLMNPDLREVLKKGSLLTRDSRKVERQKYGQKGARARFQFSKR
jgi:small subunit ribosomal protein S9